MAPIQDWSFQEVQERVLELTGDPETVNILKDEQIDGSTLLELTEQDFREMKLKMGPIKKIMKFLNELGEVIMLDVRSVDLTNPDQGNGEVLESEPATAADAPPLKPMYVPCNEDIECSQFSRKASVKDVLRAHSQGEGILRAASEGPFSETDRRCLVRILVSELVSTTGTHYPSDSCKTALAKAIVEEFPLLKDNTSGCLGYEHYFDPNARVGFIEFRLWTMRKGLSPSKKKYSSAALKRRSTQGPTQVSKRFNSDGLLTQEVLVDKLNWMRHKMPVEANRLAIKSALQETAVNRRQWIEAEKPSLSDIFEKYPRLLDFRGEMIEQDFHLQWPDHEDNFLMKFPLQYTPKILGYAMRYRPDILSKVMNLPGDDNLKALVILSALLPVTNSKAKGKGRGKGRQEKNTKKGPVTPEATLADWRGRADGTSKPSATPEVPNPDLIIILPEGSNLPLEELQRRKVSNVNVQPYLMWVKGQEIDSCFVQGDGWFVSPALPSPIAAFDLLFKLISTTNLAYPTSLTNFFSFLAVYIYEIETKPCSAVSSLHINISNFKLDNNADFNYDNDN